MRWVSLGDYIEQCDERNSKGKYGEEDVKGIATSKQLIETKANLEGVSLSSYKIVNPNEFTFVPDTSRRGDKMSLAFNNFGKVCIVSSISCVFRIKAPLELLPDYLYLWFCRPEFDRYARFNSWGSAREAFSYEDMERVQIPLLGIDEQRKIVSVWKGLRDLKVQNEVVAEPLFELCQSYIQELKHSSKIIELGDYIEQCDERNKNNSFSICDLKGVKKDGTFIDTIANTSELDLHNYKIVPKEAFAYSNRINIGSIALCHEDCIVSPSYTVFKLKNGATKYLNTSFLEIWFRREEFLRSTLFFAYGTIKDDFSYREMSHVKIPLPSMEKQCAIVNIYNCAKEARDIANKTEQLIKDICPALIRQAIGEAS